MYGIDGIDLFNRESFEKHFHDDSILERYKDGKWKWRESDAESLFEYAKNPDIGSIAGRPPHKSVEESLNVIKTVFNGAECYAICEKENEKAIGAIELILNGRTDMTERHVICRKTTIFWMPKWKNGTFIKYVYESQL